MVFKKYSAIWIVLLFGVVGICWSDFLKADTVATVRDESLEHSIRFSSFNIHYIAPGQKKLNWENRRHAVVDAINDLDADIIAFQEMETFAGSSYNTENRQLDWVIRHFPEYKAGAYGDAAIYPNTQPILYRQSRFEQLEQGFFFFSDTPNVIYSRTFNGSWPAFCSWVLLRDHETKNEFFVFNIHFEYKSMSNRGKSAALVAKRLSPLIEAKKAVVLLGDFNAPSFTPTMRKLRNIPLTLAPPTGATFHLNRGLNIIPAIDHVLFNQSFHQVGTTRLLRKRYKGVFPTDHYPVSVELYDHRVLRSE